MKRALALAAFLVVAAAPVLAGGTITMEQYRGELSLAMNREKDAKEALSQEQVRVEDLRQQNDDVLGRVSGTRREIFGILGITDYDVSSFDQRLTDTKVQLNSLLVLSGAELLQSRPRFEDSKKQIAALRQEQAGKLPRFSRAWSEVEGMIPQFEDRWTAETEAAKQAKAQGAIAAKEAAKAAKAAARAAAIAEKAEAKAARRARKATGETVSSGFSGNYDSYTVEAYRKSGDCLWKIAKQVYGDESKWEVIYDANRETIKDPDVLQPGQTLHLPR